ncbi:MAG: crossover junction endodeoxyribonuclease RuvC [Candidatus Coatesbacteria bacterium]|nr:crossover junction endodeoxyribonuclease RuvC [Candidatus Coatesbacteria bacterium]
MIVLGVDPSCRSTGYGVIEQGERNSLALVDYGAIPVPAATSLPETLHRIYIKIESIIAEFKPDVMALEAVFYAQNVRSAIRLGAVRGVVMLAARSSEVPVFEHAATEIKLAVAGFGRASKESVQKMVKVALGLKEVPTPNDAADALAAAICHLNTAKLREKISSSVGKRMSVK